MRVQESSHGGSTLRVPNNKHGVLPTVSCHNPSLVFRAHRGSDLIAMTLQQFLGFVHVVINDSRMGSAVEDFMSVVGGQVVNTLIDTFVESKNPLQVEGVDTIAFFVWRDFVPVLVVHFYKKECKL